MTLLAHQTDLRPPSIDRGEAAVRRLPLVTATRESRPTKEYPRGQEVYVLRFDAA